MIDHALLHPTLTDAEIAAGCELARRYRVATVCVKPYSVAMARDLLADSGVGVCPVIAFPHGNSSTAVKVAEAAAAVRDGGSEIDMVVNVGKVLGGDWTYVSDEIRAVNETVTAGHAILKVIFETDFLQDEHVIRLCAICAGLQVAFVKTSTGFGFVRQANGQLISAGATDHHIRLMRKHCPATVRIKASGGIRTLADLLRVRDLGAARVGTSSTAAILDEAREKGLA